MQVFQESSTASSTAKRVVMTYPQNLWISLWMIRVKFIFNRMPQGVMLNCSETELKINFKQNQILK